MKSKIISNNIPNVVTIVNLICGIVSLRLTIAENYTAAAAFILLSTFLDNIDGKLARKFDAVSDFGKELDSLADLVSFGVAPALLVYSVILINAGWLGLIAAIVFVICSALRLARFNSTEFSGRYQGLPITVAGGIVALLVLVLSSWNVFMILAFIVLLSYLMISKISIPKI